MWQARVRRTALAVIDASIAAASVVAALYLRFDGVIPP